MLACMHVGRQVGRLAGKQADRQVAAVVVDAAAAPIHADY